MTAADSCATCGETPHGGPCYEATEYLHAAELRKAEARYQRAFRRTEEAREGRNALVRQALAEGWTHARIAEATGLTRGRINQLKETAR